MSGNVFLNLLNELGGGDKMRGCAEHLIGFPQLSHESFEFNKFNNTRVRMQDSIDHMTLKSNFISKFCIKTSRFRH